MRVQVCGPNLHDQSKGEFHVHADGCADLRNYGPGKRLGGEEPWALDVSDRLGIVGEVYDWIPGEEAAAYLGEFHFAPCVASLREKAVQVGEYVAIDLDENNRKPAGTFGWGVCRHGHGLQDLPPLSERQARSLAEKLNA